MGRWRDEWRIDEGRKERWIDDWIEDVDGWMGG